jgi:hypothetical protein
MNDISTTQNEPGFLRMLHAYRQLYSEAKRTMKIRLWVSIVLALFPIGVFLIPVLANAEWMIVLIAIAVSFTFPLLLKSNEKKKIEQAAAIQEQHDVELFGIDWNESLAGPRVLTDEIVAADKRFVGERKKNWYENISPNLSLEYAALRCQLQNLSWDYKMREDYSRRFIWIFWGALITPLAAAALTEMYVGEYLVKLLMPTVPLLWLCIENYRAHRNLAEKQELKAKEIETLLYNNLSVTPDMVRKNQDAIYKFRQETMLVPDDYAEQWGKRNRK